MAFDPKDKKYKIILDFFKNKKALILEPASTIRQSIRKQLTTFGMDNLNIITAESFGAAKNIITNDLPEIVCTNLQCGDASGIDLLPIHLEAHSNREKTLFFVISSDNSMSTAAYKLNPDIESFIVEPFTFEAMQNTLVESLLKKLDISLTKKKLYKAKEYFNIKDFNKVCTLADEIVNEDTSLASDALLLKADALLAKNDNSQATEVLLSSLELNPKHHGTLNRIIEVYQKNKEYQKAYEHTVTLIKNYPINPTRIPDLIKISIANKKYDDLLNYANIFSSLSDSHPIVKMHLAAGLVICGKFLVNEHETEKGIAALLKASEMSGQKIEIIKNIVQNLIIAGAQKEASNILNKFIIENPQQNTDELKIAELEIAHQTTKDNDYVLNMATNLIKANIRTINVYNILIIRSIWNKRSAEKIQEIINEAATYFPDNEEEFNKLFSDLNK